VTPMFCEQLCERRFEHWIRMVEAVRSADLQCNAFGLDPGEGDRDGWFVFGEHVSAFHSMNGEARADGSLARRRIQVASRVTIVALASGARISCVAPLAR
jgi:hypothetical protein